MGTAPSTSSVSRHRNRIAAEADLESGGGRAGVFVHDDIETTVAVEIDGTRDEGGEAQTARLQPFDREVPGTIAKSDVPAAVPQAEQIETSVLVEIGQLQIGHRGRWPAREHGRSERPVGPLEPRFDRADPPVSIRCDCVDEVGSAVPVHVACREGGEVGRGPMLFDRRHSGEEGAMDHHLRRGVVAGHDPTQRQIGMVVAVEVGDDRATRTEGRQRHVERRPQCTVPESREDAEPAREPQHDIDVTVLGHVLHRECDGVAGRDHDRRGEGPVSQTAEPSTTGTRRDQIEVSVFVEVRCEGKAGVVRDRSGGCARK